MKEAVFIFSELLKEVMCTKTESPGLFSHQGPGGWRVAELGERILDVKSANFLTDQQEGGADR